MSPSAETAPAELLAVTWSDVAPPEALERAVARLAGGPVTSARSARAVLALTGEPAGGAPPGAREVLVHLTKGARVGDRDVTTDDVRAWLGTDGRHVQLDRVLPPFAAARMDVGSGTVRAATDYLGFRCLYSATGRGWSAVSTSTSALAVLAGHDVDRTSLATISLVGWRLRDRTHFAGVVKLPPGSSVALCDGALQVWSRTPGEQPAAALQPTVREAAAVLREVVDGALRDHPDALLQLTGGLDSRILLAAVAPRRRATLCAMTLRVPDSADAVLAADLAARYGMPHRIVDLPSAGALDPARARGLVVTGARRVDFSSDPLAWASLSLIEDELPQSPRLSGLGGEVVRGFYYVGRPGRARTTRARVARLARWRLFPNEAVPDEVLEPGFAQWRRTAALEELEAVFATLPHGWAEATDAFYLWQRMHRWAGATATSTCQDRLSLNPMLDPRFLDVGARVPPAHRAGMRFLSSILVELDPSLAALPLDGRPAPDVYARPGPANRARLASLTLRKAAGKARQRAGGTIRPAAGGASLADRVVDYWREDASDLELASRAGVVRDDVLDQIASGALAPGSTTVSLVATLAAAEGAVS